MSTPVTIEQLTGSKRAMVFKGRSLPYRPIELTVTQRVTTTWYPANPKAVQQVLGPTFEPTTITGMFKDKFLAREGVDLLNFPPLDPGARIGSPFATGSSFIGTGAFPGTQPAQLARVVCDALTLMVKEGQDVRWQWDAYVRYGKLTRFVQRPDRINDIGFELECTWSGDVEAPPIVRKTTFNLLGTASGLSKILQGLLDAAAKLDSLREPNAFINFVSTTLASIVALVGGLIDVYRKLIGIANAPDDLLATIRTNLQDLRLLARAFLAELREMGASSEAAKVGLADASQIAALVQQELRARLTELGAFAARQQRLLALFASDEILATYFADSFTSLRDVATRFYGDPTQWNAISTYNGFFSTTVPRGTVIRVPRLG